jgi:TolB-like protein/predicted membrane channel-forming protein YqfA (hemolysin III family)
MSLITELRRRNVFRVAMAYVALAWLVVQVLDSLAPLFGIVESTARLIVILMAIGLVPVLVVSWLFELTPEGFKREEEVDHDAATSRASARRLDRVIIGVLAVAVIYFAVDKFVIDPARDAEVLAEATEQALTKALLGEFGDRSIAVLPFADLSPSRDQEYFSDGVAEEIINLLSTIREIRVISRSSAFSFKGQSLPVSEIADRLGVRYVMEGSVRRAGDRLRITAQMIDALTDTQLWSENFDREFGDVFAIQDEIAAEVVDKLAVELTDEMPTSRAVDPEAYALYLQAKDRLNLQTRTAVDEAEKLLEQSLAIDDQQAAAWLLYWNIYSGKVFFYGWTWPEWAIQVREPVETALAIDPHNVRANAYLARLRLQAMSTWKGEAEALAYGMSLDPLSVEFNVEVGRFLRTLGLAERAVPYYDYATQRDPLTARLWRGKMNTNLHAGRYEDALEANTRLREIAGGAGGLWNRGRIYLALGDLDNALACFEAWAEAQPESDAGYLGLILIHATLGNDGIVAENLAKLEDANHIDFLAAAYARLGRQDEAIDLLEDHIDPPREFGPLGMREDPLFHDIRDHPRFAALLRQQGTGDDQIAAIGIDDLFPGPGLPPTVPVSPP